MPRALPAPRVEGRYKVEADDFVVVERAAYQPSGEGDHLWLRIRKRGLSTLRLIEMLAAALGRREREFGYAGLKDAFAVTEQWLSIEHQPEAPVRALDLPGVEVLAVARHRNKLKVGHLAGNDFHIVLRGAPAATLGAIRTNLAALAATGVPNYFGEQRFGKRGANLDKGLEILGGDPRRTARRIPKRILRLLVSAVQSEVFNRVVAARIDDLGRLLDGDVAFLHDRGACFRVADPAAEQPRADCFELSPTGPMPGPECLPAGGEPARIEAAAMAAIGLDPARLAVVPHGTNLGERRPLRMPLTDPEAEAAAEGVRLRFGLPKGGYATSVLRELLVEAPWFAG